MVENEKEAIISARDFIFHDHDYKFYLTGSRYFGGATENSDYDFFIQDSDEVARDLLHHGFELLPSYSCDGSGEKRLARDHDIIRVMRFTDTDINGKPFQIDVQLVADVKRRAAIIKWAKYSELIPKLSKKDRPDFWNLLRQVYLSGGPKKKRGLFGGRS